jgi:hypothetical protein
MVHGDGGRRPLELLHGELEEAGAFTNPRTRLQKTHASITSSASAATGDTASMPIRSRGG